VIGTSPRVSSGLISNYNSTLYLYGNTFLGTKKTTDEPIRTIHDTTSSSGSLWVDSSATFIGYLVGNIGGYIELQDNCFVDNDVTLGPVVSRGGEMKVSLNGGRNTSGTVGTTCNFVAVLDEFDAETFTSEDTFMCVEFDDYSCVDGEEWGIVEESSESDGPVTLNPSSLKSSGTTARNNGIVSSIVLACLFAVVALIAATGAVYHRRRAQNDVNEVIIT
jgi:hypothetical protein